MGFLTFKPVNHRRFYSMRLERSKGECRGGGGGGGTATLWSDKQKL